MVSRRFFDATILNSFGIALLCGAIAGDFAWAQIPKTVSLQKPGSLEIRLKASANCTKNIVYLSDLAELNGSEALVDSFKNSLIAAAPMEGQSNRWSRVELQRQLELRGLSSTAIHWSGADECTITRNAHPSYTNPWRSKSTASSSAQNPPGSVATTLASTSGQIKSVSNGEIQSEFAPSLANRTLIAQAQRNVDSEIQSFLQAKTGENVAWTISSSIPDKHIVVLAQQSSIRGISGNSSPQPGKQLFVLMTVSSDGEQKIEVEADLRLPELVASATGPIRRGQILKASDLKMVPYRANSNLKLEACAVDVSQLVGKELKRAVSTGQVIGMSEVMSPRLIDRNEQVEVEVIAGGVSILAYARSLESGGLDDLIQVEIIPNKKRVMARVIDERRVQIVSTGRGAR